MSDAARAPLLDPQGSFEFPAFDGGEDFLEELRVLEDLEAGGMGNPGMLREEPEREHIEDEDVYKMKELIDEKPRDVIQYIEEEGVVKLGEFDVQDALAFKAFGKESILTTGAEHFECDWEAMWRERLEEGGKLTGIGWSTSITMEALVVNLHDAAAEGAKGLLHPLLKRYQARGCSMAVFALPAVQAVIHYKWTSWARRFLMYELMLYGAWLAAFTAFTLLFQHEDVSLSFWGLLANRWGLAGSLMSLASVAAMLPFLYMELCTIHAYKLGWLTFLNLMDMASYVLQIVIFVLHLQRQYVNEGWFSVLVATQTVFMWSKLHYFARVFNPTKNLFVDSVRIVVDDMKWFLAFLSLTMIGFGLAFYALYRHDMDNFPDFQNVWHAFATMFSFLLAMFDYNVFYNSQNSTAAMILFIVFEFITYLIMLNIMIASMTSSFAKVTQDEALRFLASKAEIIDELENTLPRWIRTAAWYPRFVHVLKFHPAAQYEVNLHSVWSGLGLMESNLLTAQQETRLCVDEIEDKMSRMNKKLDVMVKMMLGIMSPAQQLVLQRQLSTQFRDLGALKTSTSEQQIPVHSPMEAGRSGTHTPFSRQYYSARGTGAAGGSSGRFYVAPIRHNSNGSQGSRVPAGGAIDGMHRSSTMHPRTVPSHHHHHQHHHNMPHSV